MARGTGELRHSNVVSFVQFLPDGKHLATIAGTNLNIWDRTTRSLVETRVVPSGKHPVLSADAKTFAVTQNNQNLGLWREGQEVRVWDSRHVQSGSHQVRLALSPDARTLVSAVALGTGSGFTLQVWDAGNRKSGDESSRSHFFHRGSGFSHSGDVLASAGFDQTIQLGIRARGSGLPFAKGIWLRLGRGVPAWR
jgi:WD40 repeat protein